MPLLIGMLFLTCRIAKDGAGSPHPLGWSPPDCISGVAADNVSHRMKAESFALASICQ